jgi:hypothetical protein
VQNKPSEAHLKQAAAALQHSLNRTKLFREVFGTPAGKEVLDIIVKELCGYRTRLGILSGDAALYAAGRRDVAHAINEIMDWRPEDAAVVVKRKDGQ